MNENGYLTRQRIGVDPWEQSDSGNVTWKHLLRGFGSEILGVFGYYLARLGEYEGGTV